MGGEGVAISLTRCDALRNDFANDFSTRLMNDLLSPALFVFAKWQESAIPLSKPTKELSNPASSHEQRTWPRVWHAKMCHGRFGLCAQLGKHPGKVLSQSWPRISRRSSRKISPASALSGSDRSIDSIFEQHCIKNGWVCPQMDKMSS